MNNEIDNAFWPIRARLLLSGSQIIFTKPFDSRVIITLGSSKAPSCSHHTGSRHLAELFNHLRGNLHCIPPFPDQSGYIIF